jgi:Cys-rich repeat protein
MTRLPLETRRELGLTAVVALALAAASCGETRTVTLLGGTPKISFDGSAADAGSVTHTACTANTDCAAPKAFCDTLIAECVQCLAHEDCSTMVCDSVSHTCTGCVTNADCGGATPICDRDDRKCVECTEVSQCPNGEVCAWAAHRCAPACQTNSDCAGSGHPICAAASRVCVECTSDAECVAMNLGPYCNLRLGACVECLSDAHCVTGHCYTFENFCVECTSDADCSGRVCDAFICRG